MINSITVLRILKISVKISDFCLVNLFVKHKAFKLPIDKVQELSNLNKLSYLDLSKVT
jgi:hypothetical protein